MRGTYEKDLNSNKLSRKSIEELLAVFDKNKLKLIDIKKEIPSLLHGNSSMNRISGYLGKLELYVCRGNKSWEGLVVGFPGEAEDLSTFNVSTPYIRKILYPILDLHRRIKDYIEAVEGKRRPMPCIYILGSRINEVFRVKFRLLNMVVPHVIILTSDLLKCASNNNPAKIPTPKTKIAEDWIQQKLCEKMISSGGLALPSNGGNIELTLKLFAYELPTSEGTKDPERLDILGFNVKDNSIVAFEIKGHAGRVELENLFLQGFSHREWLEENKMAIKFLFDSKGVQGILNTKKRVKLIVGFCGDTIPDIFYDLKAIAVKKDKHLEINFFKFETPLTPDGELKIVNI